METYNDYLAHHGILGMKWGVMNGPPYPLGKTKVQRLRERNKRLQEKKKIQDLKIKNDSLKRRMLEEKRANAEANKQSKPPKVISARKQARQIRKLENKSIKKMSNEELDTALSRRRKEKELRELNKSSLGYGKAFVRQLLVMGGTTAATLLVTKLATKKAEHWASRWMFKHPDAYKVDYSDVKKTVDNIKDTVDKTVKGLTTDDKKKSKGMGVLGLFDTRVPENKDEKGK